MDAEIEIIDPEQRVRRERLVGDVLTLGRAHSNDLCYPDDASLSRFHCKLVREDAGWKVVDLDSKNGTLVNGRRVAGPESFRPGDRLSAGQLTVVFVDPTASRSSEVVFVPAPEAVGPSATVMTSLEGLLSGETTSPLAKAPSGAGMPPNPFNHPVVRALIRAGRELAGIQPLDELFPLILDLSIETVGAERGVLLTLERDGLVTRALRGEGFRISSAVRDRVLVEKTSMLVHDMAQEELLRNQMSVVGQQIRSLMAAPLQTQDQVIGLIYVDSRLFGRQFTSDDLSLLTVLANVAAIRIDHERHLQLQQQEQRRTRDLEQAAEIQRAILPTAVPRVPGLDLAGHNAACRTVGGDYYDFFPYPDGRLGIVLGDVAGKGMAAALLMSNLQARVQMLASEVGDLAALMGRLDRALATRLPDNRFITMFMGLVDPTDDALTFCNAGHDPPLLVHGDEVRRLAAGGSVLGILPDIGYAQQRVPFEPGDLLAIFSDGVTEARSPAGVEFGLSRLNATLLEHRERPASEIVQAVAAAISVWTAAAPPEDDITVVVVRRTDGKPGT